MIILLGKIAGTILLLLSALHFHWAFGGSFGFEAALPTTTDGKRVLNPKKIDSAVVGFGLLFFAIIYFLKSSATNFELPSLISDYGLWLIVVIFFARSIGDFKYVGFFKKVKGTDFANMDNKFYAPLCLFLAISGLIIELSN